MSARLEFEAGLRRLGVVALGDDGHDGHGGRRPPEARVLVIRSRGTAVVSSRVVGPGEAARACSALYGRDPLFADKDARRTLSKLSARAVRRVCARFGVDVRASRSRPHKAATKKVLVQRMLGALRCEGARTENNVADARNDGGVEAPRGPAVADAAAAPPPHEHRDATGLLRRS